MKSLPNIAPSVIFEPSLRHRSNYANCHTCEGLVTLNEHTASSGSFHIVITNNSNQYVKATKNQTLGMLKSCDSDQICTIHRIVTFEPKPLGGEGIKPIHTKSPHYNNKSEIQTITKDFITYQPEIKRGK